jgi:cytochrome b561
MQQQIARETKRDSSALKSISLLTMVFLPATAIAVNRASALASLLITSKTVMAPFISISSDNKVIMTSQFWIFWVVAGPVTLLVIVLWVSWIQRSEIMTTLVNKRANELEQRRV